MTPCAAPSALLLPPEEAEARSRMGTHTRPQSSHVRAMGIGRPEWRGLPSSFLALVRSFLNAAQQKACDAMRRSHGVSQ